MKKPILKSIKTICTLLEELVPTRKTGRRGAMKIELLVVTVPP